MPEEAREPPGWVGDQRIAADLALGAGGRLVEACMPVNLAAALRHHARDPRRPLAILGITLG
jgi:hypothetical protein